MSLKFEVINTKILGLAGKFSVNPNSCEVPDFYKRYLIYIAYRDQLDGSNTTHVLYDDETDEIFGFLSLRATSIISEGETTIGEPALEISVLAVDQNHERRGVGSLLIDFAIAEADALHSSFLGIRNIVLMADHKAVGFYERRGFVQISDYMDYQLPRVSWNAKCVPMMMRLNFNE